MPSVGGEVAPISAYDLDPNNYSLYMNLGPFPEHGQYTWRAIIEHTPSGDTRKVLLGGLGEDSTEAETAILARIVELFRKGTPVFVQDPTVGPLADIADFVPDLNQSNTYIENQVGSITDLASSKEVLERLFKKVAKAMNAVKVLAKSKGI